MHVAERATFQRGLSQREGQNRELTSHPQLLSKPRKSSLDPALKGRFPGRAGTRKQCSGEW